MSTKPGQCQRAGEDVSKCSVMYVNNQSQYPNLDDFFLLNDVTSEIELRLPMISAQVVNLQEMMKGEIPEIDIGAHCNDPYECQFKNHCWNERGIKSPSIFEIPGFGKKAWELYREGIISLLDPRLEGLNEKQSKVIEVIRRNKTWIDKEAIRNELCNWKWPLHILDFETFGPAVPIYKGIHPYQQVPFQFSCHVLDRIDCEPTHVEFIHDTSADPRSYVAKALVEAIGESGSIVAYNKSVEIRAIEQLADYCPEMSETLRGWSVRFVDPLQIVRAFVYSPNFKGSYSIKKVAPALLGADFIYDELDVAGGQEAQASFRRLISDETSPKEKEDIKEKLLKYCAMDTMSLAMLVKWLFSQSLP